MVACLEHYENDVCTKREIIKITAKNNDTFTVTRWFAVCIMNDETKQQWQEIQTFSVGDFLSLYLSKELRESITQNIWINETALQTMVWHLNSPRTYINDNCLSWKQSIDSAYNTKYWWLAGFGDASDGDLVITEDTFLDASREYNFNNLTICANATLRFCWLWVPTINVRNNFKNYWTIDMRAPYLQARNTELTDHRLFTNDKVSNNTDDLTQLWTEWWFYKWWSGAGWTASWSDASDWHGWNGWSGGAYDWINGWNGWTSWSFWTGGWWWFWMWKGWTGWTGACGWWNGWNWFHWWQWWNVTSSSRFDGGWWAGGLWVIRWWDAWWWVWSCDYNTLWNGWSAITNVYWLHLNARNIWNNLVTAKWWDGGNGGIYYWYWTSWWFAPTWWNGWNGANWWEIMVSYDTMHEQWTFDVSWWMGWIGAKMWFSSESCWRYEQPNWTDWTAWRVVFKSSKSPYIQDLMLQNDSDNEAILISWKDPRVLSWNKTIIRYSTTDYPANLTDWTLAIEETTRNQYVLTPYSLVGVSDQTTYYFTAFALDSNNVIIDTETATITTEFGRQPWVNTIAYYPLETNGDEASWKSWLNITTTWITFSNNVAILDGNQRATVNSITWYKTICFWFKKTNDVNWMIITQWNTDGYIQLRTNGFAAAWTWWWSFNNDYTAWWSTPSNVWRLCVITQTVANDSWSSTWSMKFYLSDFWWVSWVRQYDTTNHYLNWGITRIGWSGNTSYPYALIWEMSQLIFESTERTAQEISDYYNQTKWNYGL